MDVFDIAAGAGGEFLRAAAIDAGYELGVFAALATAAPTEAVTVDRLAATLAVRGVRRLGALLDVLAALGAVARRDDGFVAGSPPPRPVVARAGWGLMAGVIRTDRPLPIDRSGGLKHLHAHLAAAGQAAARALVGALDGTSLLDLGGGAGGYTEAYLDAHPSGTATLIDLDDVIALARDRLARFADRVELRPGDIRTIGVPEGHDATLLANVLHFYSPEVCGELCAAAFRGTRPGGVAIIKDLRVDDGRAGPLEGLLFALNMAIYTDDGDVHATAILRAYLERAGFVEVTDRRLEAAPDAVVVLGRRPMPAGYLPVDAARIAEVTAELDAALVRTTADEWARLERAGALLPSSLAFGAPTLAIPDGLRDTLARGIALERAAGDGEASCAAALVRHYTDAMPRMRIAQLASTAAPAATVFHAPLDWDRLPRLAAAIDQLFAVVCDAGVAAEPCLGAPSASALRAATPTLAALYQRTHYGALMPLLYGYPADLEFFIRRGGEDGIDLLTTIDRYLTAPMIHELCHFARHRAPIQPAHLDECIGGWLGVHVHPEMAYPAPGQDNALFAAPWLAQVGQAVARGLGIGRVVRAHAGTEPWAYPVSRPFAVAAAQLGWVDWCKRRTLHFLSDTLDPTPWVALALTAGAGQPVVGLTLEALARARLVELAPLLRPDPGFDRAIVADALRAMCLNNVRIDGSFRTRTRVPEAPIEIDAAACRVTTTRRGDVDTVAPSYWLPPPVAARIAARGLAGYALRLGAIDAIHEAAAAIHDGSPGLERPGFALVGHRAPAR